MHTPPGPMLAGVMEAAMVVWLPPEAPPCRLPPADEPLKAPAGSELGSPPWSSPPVKLPAPPPPVMARCSGSCPTSAEAATLSLRQAGHKGSEVCHTS